LQEVNSLCWRFQEANQGLHTHQADRGTDDHGQQTAQHSSAQFLQVLHEGHFHLMG
jgi:hypothetical protein